jgi:hypothetical protein
MDSYRLSLGATTLDLGSYVLADPGPDFDPGALLRPQFSENPYADGGQFVLEDSVTRTFKFPLRIASSVAFTSGVEGLEQLIRLLARPGAVIDVQPEGLPTVQAPRFDVLAGQVKPAYSVYQQRAGRRELNLELSVSPFGYMPTSILLASAASVGLPGSLSLSGASILGDAPALADIVISPTSATSYSIGTWGLDMVGWSVAARASFQPFWPAASLTVLPGIAGSLTGDQFAPASQALGLFSFTGAQWQAAAAIDIPAVLEPAYRGRHRAFAWANLGPSQALPWSVALDVVPRANTGAALASGGRVASINPEVRGGLQAAASPAYMLLDLGDVTMPPVGSGIPHAVRLRLWTDVSGTNPGVNPILSFGGLFLLPLDGPAGILPRGLAQPSVAPVGSIGRLVLSGLADEAFVGEHTGNLSTYSPVAPAALYTRAALPKLGASTVSLSLVAANARMGAHPYLLDELQGLPLLAYYRMADPAGASAIAPLAGFGPTGLASVASAGQAGALWGGPSHAALFFTGSSNSLAVASVVGMPSAFTLFSIYKRASAVGSQQHLVGGGSSPQGFALYFDANSPRAVYGGGIASGVPSYPNPDASYHSLAMTIDGGGSPIVGLYLDGSLIATRQGGSWGGATHNLYFSTLRGFVGTLPFAGFESETALIGTWLSGTGVKRIHDSAFSPTGGATTPLVRASEAFAAVSVSYRPRFQFLRGI